MRTTQQVKDRLQQLADGENVGWEARRLLDRVTATEPVAFLDEAYELAQQAGYGQQAAPLVATVRNEIKAAATDATTKPEATAQAVLNRLRDLVNEKVPAFNRPTATEILNQVADEFGITEHPALALAKAAAEANGWNGNAVDAFIAGWDAAQAAA